MKNTDKVLLGILAGIALLIILALVMTLTRPVSTYQADDTPEGVAHNYLLALQNEDYDRAYGYLATTLEGYPRSLDKFVENIHGYPYYFRLDQEVSFSIVSAKVTGNNATVKVHLSSFRGGGIFDSGQSSYDFEMSLRREAGRWKIASADSYFASCWQWEQGCK
jgi:hypothetical protein